MKIFIFVACLSFISCAGSKPHLSNGCSPKLQSAGYIKISDSAFAFEMKKIGRTYLDFIIDSCQLITKTEVNLIGHVAFADGAMRADGRKMPDTDIILATQTAKGFLQYIQYLGKTDQAGKFDIRVSSLKKDLFILLDKQNFTYTSVSLSF